MHKAILVEGGHTLSGKIKISGSKNSALPILIASLLAKNTITINNIPNITDVMNILKLLKYAGAKVDYHKDTNKVIIEPAQFYNTNFTDIPLLVKKTRASILLTSAMLVRIGSISIPRPGGCDIGTRPIDIHINALKKMGVIVEDNKNYIKLIAHKPLKGSEINLPMPSVGATTNIMIAATLAEGVTQIKNAAMEPEIMDLANFLNKLGAKITKTDTQSITIQGTSSLTGGSHRIINDRIEAASYALAAIITKGEIELVGKDLLQNSVKQKIIDIGGTIIDTPDGVLVKISRDITSTDITTMPYPGFPSDVQPQFTSVLSLANGASVVKENLFENRYQHAKELKKMGADIYFTKNTMNIRGKKNLVASTVEATDLRSAMSLVLAALATKGKTIINNPFYLDRGYENAENKLEQCGAIIRRVSLNF